MGTTYDSTAIKGLTAEDMIRTMNGKYGPAMSPGGR
jgi:hypothetical protein